MDTNVEALQEIEQASSVVTEPVHTEQSLERLYEQWSSTPFGTTVLEVAKAAVDGKVASDQFLDRVDGYLALVALETEVNPPGKAYINARDAVKEQIGSIPLVTEDQAIEGIIDLASQAANSPTKTPENPTPIPEPKLEDVPTRIAIVNFIRSLPDGLLDKGSYRSTGSIIVEKLTPFGHSHNAIRNAVKKLVDDGVLIQTKPSPNSAIVDSLQLANDAQERLTQGSRLDRRNYSNKNDRVFDFMYKDKNGQRISVDLNRAEFMALAVRDRFLIVAAKFQNLRFLNGSVYESILKATNLKKNENITDIDVEDLVLIDDHSAKLTETGERILREIEGVKAILKKPESILQPRDESPETGALPVEKSDTRVNPEITKLRDEFKKYLAQRGAGIMPLDGKSVSGQIMDICVNELGATKELAGKMFGAVKRDPEILKLSFKAGAMYSVEYIGLAELQDDPLSRGHIIVDDLKKRLDDYGTVLRQQGLALDPRIEKYITLCDLMTSKEWLDYSFAELEQYTSQLLAAMREVAQLRRVLTAR